MRAILRKHKTNFRINCGEKRNHSPHRECQVNLRILSDPSKIIRERALSVFFRNHLFNDLLSPVEWEMKFMERQVSI